MHQQLTNILNWFKRILKRKKTLLIILFVYILLVAIYYYFFLYKPQWYCTKEFLDKIEPGFAVSFSASLLEDFIVFIALSFVIILLTTKDLFDYSFSEKITAIINSENSNDPKLNNFLQSKVARLLAYDKNIKFNLTVTDYNQNINAYKIYFVIEYVIKNMCRDKEFKLDEDYKFHIDRSDISLDKDFGLVTSFVTKKSGEKPIIHIDETNEHSLEHDFDVPIDLIISKDKNFKIKFRYHTWSKTGEEFKVEKDAVNFYNYVQSKRYVEKVSIQINNRLNRPLKHEILIKEKQKDNIKLLSLEDDGIIQVKGHSQKIIDDGLYPDDNAIVYFHKP